MNPEQTQVKINPFSFFWRKIVSFFILPFWRNHLNLGFIIASVAFNGLAWFFLAYFIHPSEFPIPLHYNIYFGIDLIGEYQRVFSLPLIGFLVILINSILAFWFYLKERLISYMLILSALAVQIFVVIGAISLIYINQ